MLESLELLPADPILGVSLAFAADQHPNKVNLGVGVYRDDHGHSPIFEAVKTAERDLLGEQDTKAYVAQAGDPAFLDRLTKLVVGDELVESHGDRLRASTMVGGSGALRIAAELTLRANPEAVAWVSSPTWGNHFPLLSGSGIRVQEYEYYDAATGQVDFDLMMSSLANVQAGDLVVLHACCHNPTGADLSTAQWAEVINLADSVGFVPLIDLAYQGFADSLEEDTAGIRLAISQLPEVLVAGSCSKSFGLYRERSGILMILGRTAAEVEASQSHVLAIARQIYSMPGYHGPAIVGRLLGDDALRHGWVSELAAARLRLETLRSQFATLLNEAQDRRDFTFLANQKGMFSLLGFDRTQVAQLQNEHNIYVVGTSRINIAGLSERNIKQVASAVAGVLNSQ